jgi:L-ascorbate metabolism protein UlaG (beta-lactamase superfamily)
MLMEPYTRHSGLTPPRQAADVVTFASATPPTLGDVGVTTPARVICGPGEYEIKGIFIQGIRTRRRHSTAGASPHTTIYLAEVDGVLVCHLGDLDHVPSAEEVEALGKVDVLLVPVGGGGALNAVQAAEVISLIEPRLVVPMRYRMDGVATALEPLERFRREMGLDQVRVEPKLSVTPNSLSDEPQVIALEARRS